MRYSCLPSSFLSLTVFTVRVSYSGVLELCNGDKISGGFSMNEPHGYCEMSLYGDNINYKGHMKNGKRHGKGRSSTNPPNRSSSSSFETNVYIIPSRFLSGLLIDTIQRISYEGEFANDLFHGMGIYTFLNRTKENVFSGNFIAGEAEGN